MRKCIVEIAAALLITAALAYGHCDSLDGPVVQAARRALADGDVNLVLSWVQGRDEPAIRQAFAQTLAVRKLNPEAEKLADTWFFETLVRVHRAGEGASFEGLKPAGADISPALSAADKAIETGNLQGLDSALTGSVQEGLRSRFARVRQAANYKPSDVNAGREYVAAYVDFIHFAERVHEATAIAAHAH
jgi:hypothetical protein